MGNKTGILQRCGAAVAFLALLAPTTTRPATLPESPSVGGVACLSDAQRTELLHREMLEFMNVGKELGRHRGAVHDAQRARDEASAALGACRDVTKPSGASACEEERERLERSQAQLQRAQAGQEKARAEFLVLASSRIQAVRSEYPACDSR